MVIVHFCLHLKHCTLAAVGSSETGIDKPLVWLIPACDLYFPFMQISPVALTELSSPFALRLAGSKVCSCMPPQNYFPEGQKLWQVGISEIMMQDKGWRLKPHVCENTFSLCICSINTLDISSGSVINFSFFLCLNSMVMCLICWSQVGRPGAQSWNLLQLRLL